MCLGDLFGEAELLEALTASPRVQRALAGAEPQDLGELVGMVSEMHCAGRRSLAEDFLKRFAFESFEGDRVVVRIASELPCSARGGQLEEFTLQLPVPEELRPALVLAKEGGTLLPQLKRVSPLGAY